VAISDAMRAKAGGNSRQVVVDVVSGLPKGEPFGVTPVARLSGLSDPTCRQALAELAEAGAITVHTASPLRYVRGGDAISTSLPETAPAPAPAEGLTHPAAGSDPASADGGQDSGPEPPPLAGKSAENHVITTLSEPPLVFSATLESSCDEDEEIAALYACVEAVKPLDERAVRRVIAYLEDRFLP